MSKYISYLRVSTQKQGAEGLGISAQRAMCEKFVRSKGGEIIKEFLDVESGKSRTRAELWRAIEYAKANNVPLVIAKLDRLARDVEFTFKVMNTGIEIHFCDMPVVNTMILGVFASVAQYEREMISARTKAAFDAKKARGETWVRNLDTSKAVEASAKARTARSRSHPSNVFFLNYVKQFEKRNGKLTPNRPKEVYDLLSDELNALGQRTVTGLPYNSNRCRAILTRIR